MNQLSGFVCDFMLKPMLNGSTIPKVDLPLVGVIFYNSYYSDPTKPVYGELKPSSFYPLYDSPNESKIKRRLRNLINLGVIVKDDEKGYDIKLTSWDNNHTGYFALNSQTKICFSTRDFPGLHGCALIVAAAVRNNYYTKWCGIPAIASKFDICENTIRKYLDNAPNIVCRTAWSSKKGGIKYLYKYEPNGRFKPKAWYPDYVLVTPEMVRASANIEDIMTLACRKALRLIGRKDDASYVSELLPIDCHISHAPFYGYNIDKDNMQNSIIVPLWTSFKSKELLVLSVVSSMMLKGQLAVWSTNAYKKHCGLDNGEVSKIIKQLKANNLLDTPTDKMVKKFEMQNKTNLPKLYNAARCSKANNIILRFVPSLGKQY